MYLSQLKIQNLHDQLRFQPPTQSFVYAVMYLCEDIPKSVIFMRHYLLGKWIRPVTEAGIRGYEEYNE